MRGRPAHETPRWKESPRGRRSRPIPRGGREATGPEEEGPRPTPSLAKGTHTVHARSNDNRMLNPLHFRADQPTKGWHKDTPRTGRKNRSQEPNCSNSFNRDQIVRSRPDRGDPILKEYRPDIQSRLRYDRVGEKHTRPAGWPIMKQLRIDERKKPSFWSSAQKCATRPDTGDPIAKAQHQPLGKVRRVFVPIEIWDKLDPTGWPHREDSNQTPGRWRKRLRFHRGLRQTRPGKVTSLRRLDAKP